MAISSTPTAAEINVELGRAATAPFSINGAEERALAGIPSGPISFSDFIGKSAALFQTFLTVGNVSANEGYNASVFQSAYGSIDQETFTGLDSQQHDIKAIAEASGSFQFYIVLTNAQSNQDPSAYFNTLTLVGSNHPTGLVTNAADWEWQDVLSGQHRYRNVNGRIWDPVVGENYDVILN